VKFTSSAYNKRRTLHCTQSGSVRVAFSRHVLLALLITAHPTHTYQLIALTLRLFITRGCTYMLFNNQANLKKNNVFNLLENLKRKNQEEVEENVAHW
jgi:hypothetical protein